MKKLIAILLTLMVTAILCGTSVIASDSQPSAKVTAQIAELDVMAAAATTGEDVDWDLDADTILTQTIKTANQKDLVIDVSLLSGLYTGTVVKSKGGITDTSGAAAAVVVAVFVDDAIVFPGYPVVFEGRMQILTATLGGYLVDDVLTDEEIGLIIGTLSANAFNFIAPDLPVGVHTVEVKAACFAGAFSEQGSASAIAAIGLGSVVIESVRMIKAEDVIIELE